MSGDPMGGLIHEMTCSVVRSWCASSTSCSFARTSSSSIRSTTAWWCVWNSVSESESFWDMSWAVPSSSSKRLVSRVTEARATPLLFLALASDRPVVMDVTERDREHVLVENSKGERFRERNSHKRKSTCHPARKTKKKFSRMQTTRYTSTLALHFTKFIVLSNLAYRKIEMHDVMYNIRK